MRGSIVFLLASSLVCASALAQSPWEGDVGAQWPETAVDVPVAGCAGLERAAQLDVLIAAMRAEPDPAVRGIAQISSECFYRTYRSDGTQPAAAATAWSRVADALARVEATHPDGPILAAARTQQAGQLRRWHRIPPADVAREPIVLELSVWFIVDAAGTVYAIVDRRIEHGLAYGAHACPPTPGGHCDPVGPTEGVSFEVHDDVRVRAPATGRATIVRHRLEHVGPLHGD